MIFLDSLTKKENRKSSLVFSLILFLYSPPLWGESKKDNQEPPQVGNFALPISQQPASLIGLGMSLIEKNQTQLYFYTDYLKGNKSHAVDFVPSLVHGVTDDFSVTFAAPIAPSYKEEKARSSGMGDMLLQLEYAYYNNSTYQYSDQATFVANVTYPTGSDKKDPAIGLGSTSFLLGGLLSRMYTDWFGYAFPGVTLTTAHHDKKDGNTVLYQFGLGRNIYSTPSQWIFAGLVEIDGAYAEKDKMEGKKDPDSGGNVVFITPSLFFSTQRLIFQVGAGVPLIQRLYGHQKKNHYLLVTSVGLTF